MSNLITQQLIQQVRIPPPGSRNVWKEECSLSFHTQESEGGIFVDLNSWVAFSPNYVSFNYEKNGHAIYLNIKKTYKLKPVENPKVEDKPVVLGIGVEGGFKTEEDKWEPEFTYTIVILPSFTQIPLSSPDLPDKVKQAADAIIACDSAEKKEEIKTWVADAGSKVSSYAENLVQLAANRNLSGGNWTCDVCGGDAKTNLWLNLTDGHIGCGRKNFDGSGGQGHALTHFDKTGFPLVVKLGTITAEGADVHSYLEDEMVIDPHLENHLAHWGLNMKTLVKTDKTVAELEIELQHNFDWSKAQEKGAILVPVYGPGFTGIQNLGNTCYMASVFQILFKIPEFIDRYGKFGNIIKSANLNEAPRDFHVQLAKLAHGLLSGELSKPPTEKTEQEKEKHHPKSPTVRPFMLKSLIGEGHQEFSTNRQQDALEFLQYFLQLIERRERARGDGVDPSVVFQFSLQERLQCSTSKCSKYSVTPKQNTLLLPIPLERATNKEDVEAYNKRQAHKTEEEKKKEREAGIAEDPVWPLVPLSACFERWSSDEFIEDWFSPIIRNKTVAIKRKRFNEFPKYLVLQMGRFVVTGYQASKLDVFIGVPNELDLEFLRATEPPVGELQFPSDAGEEEPIKFNEDVINALLAMGFTRVRSEHAAFNTVGQGPEAAMEWLFGHMDDPSIDIPLKKKKTTPQKESVASVPEDSIIQLMNMGFDRNRCVKALQSTSNNVERALDWLFSHTDDPMEDSAPPQATPEPSTSTNVNAPGKYKLLGFVTHMGKSTETGHYVAHIQSEGQWYIFNDNKVAHSQDPPLSMAYIYFYKRIDA